MRVSKEAVSEQIVREVSLPTQWQSPIFHIYHHVSDEGMPPVDEKEESTNQQLPSGRAAETVAALVSI